MKKLYLLLLVFLLLFIPATNAVTPYQLDYPIRELNGYTLREIFENRNIGMPDLDGKIDLGNGVYRLYDLSGVIIDYNKISGQYKINGTTTSAVNLDLFDIEVSTQYYISYYAIIGSLVGGGLSLYITQPAQDIIVQTNQNIDKQNSFISTTQNNFRFYINSGRTFDNYTFKFQLEKGSQATPYQVPTVSPYSDIDVGEFNLTTEQIDMYYYYYLEAVQFEIDYYEAGQDPGEYQHIFKSIINGVKNLISEMGGVWQFLNAPIVSTNPNDFGFNIDWSWDLIGVIKQIFNNLAVIILQVSFLIPTAIFNIFNIPVQISLLSLLFTNFVFVLLGWIVVKSFII